MKNIGFCYIYIYTAYTLAYTHNEALLGPPGAPRREPKIAGVPRIPWRIPAYSPAYTQKSPYPVVVLRAAFLQHAPLFLTGPRRWPYGLPPPLTVCHRLAAECAEACKQGEPPRNGGFDTVQGGVDPPRIPISPTDF